MNFDKTTQTDDCECGISRHGKHNTIEHRDGMVSRCGICAAPGHYTSSHPDTRKIETQLPLGWEMRTCKRNGIDTPYFVDHNTRKNTWDDPRIKK